ncbi:uncharacterized protein FIBRA_02246 [Fibroporia radiculosa]|uniref:Methyltransferase type 11 domain-containing protein n=1 Tax=Fibroporia radiculosa TaxID=599839 RepID=J4G1G5_9APHY|nr:uncharacterized protein FIBRA_02246 [Fibroporia radiculosa]CCM00218.1 predicted protein [Fibroporia radiculosa]
MSHLWIPFGDGIDENARPVKENLITPNARGVVLDIGAGHGHTVNYLSLDTVTKYIALEPNQLMHAEIRARANAAGFTEESDTFQILPYGAEDVASIVSSLGRPDAVDTFISVLTLCSIPNPEDTLAALVELVLKPGGQLLFYEHVLSPRDDVAWWQRFWTPLWSSVFDGCCLDRPTHIYVKRLDLWSSGEVWVGEGESEENMLWHQLGKFVKRSM